MFVHEVVPDRGSAQDIFNYQQVAKTMGHEVVLYGPPRAGWPFQTSLDLDGIDAAVFIFEWTNWVREDARLDYPRLLGRIPRRRRVVIDCDGKFNDVITVAGDGNHADAAASRRWIAVAESISDKIFQPTWHPARPNVRPFLFHAYNPEWARPLDVTGKAFGLYYVGNNWYRWPGMHRVLRAVEPIREHIGRIGIVGHGWHARAPWAKSGVSEEAYYSDPAYFEKLEVEAMPAVAFAEVIDAMSRGTCSPVIYRPLFDRLRLVTCRTFETPAADTVPLFTQDRAFVREVYGAAAEDLVLPEIDPHERILDMVTRPERYVPIVREIRADLSARHSYAARLRELVEIVDG
jgi:hypothetical protein